MDGSGTLLILVAFVVGIAWLAFPFIVVWKLNDVIAAIRDLKSGLGKNDSAAPSKSKLPAQPLRDYNP